jgi:FMN-dependent NADH-azoreductase
MAHLLVIESSPLSTGSFSRRLTQKAVELAVSADPGLEIIRRDLAAQPVPHLNEATVLAMRTPPDQLTEAQQAALEFSNLLVDELLAADLVLIGSPMYNFGAPSALKAYIDHISRPGRTFRYSEAGRPEGLLAGKSTLILTAAGGVYSQGQARALDFLTPYLRSVFGVLGIEAEFVHIEGVAFGPEAAAAAATQAEAELLTSTWARAVAA